MTDTSTRQFTAGIPVLKNKQGFPEWDQRLKLSVGAAKKRSFILPSAAPPLLSSTPTPDEVTRRTNWLDNDYQLSSLILQTCSSDIVTATSPLLDNPLVISKSYAIYSQLVAKYGTSGTQYKHTLLRKFMDSKCGDEDDVGEWVNRVKAEMAELKALGVNLDTLCVTILLHGLPDRFINLVDIVWTQTAPPTPDSVSDQITTIDAGQKSRGLQTIGNNYPTSAFVAQLQALGLSTNDVHALAARTGKKPSALHRCLRCDSPDHWVPDCPHPPVGHSNGPNPGKSSGKQKPTAAMVAAASPLPMTESRALALVAPGITSFSDDVEFEF